MTVYIGQVYAKTETELSGPIELVQFVTKTRLDNNMVNCIGTIYTKNETEYQCLIELSAVCDEN